MNKLLSITPHQLNKVRPVLLKFIRHHGDKRITHQAIHWFSKLNSRQLQEGTHITIALNQQKLIGLVVFGNYGLDEAFTAVHKDYRNQGIGEMLLKHSLTQLDRVYTRVSTDNIPSLNLCFSCGLVAFGLTKGPTGKPTLILGGGNWNPSEFNHAESLKRK